MKAAYLLMVTLMRVVMMVVLIKENEYLWKQITLKEFVHLKHPARQCEVPEL